MKLTCLAKRKALSEPSPEVRGQESQKDCCLASSNNGEAPRSSAAVGFTLLEVVVAMTIIGLGVVTLLEIFSLGLRLGARSSSATEAVSYGRQAIDNVLLRRKLQPGSEQGSVNEKNRWKLQVQPMQQESSTLTLSSPWELQEISLELQTSDEGRQKTLEFKTLRLVRKENR